MGHAVLRNRDVSGGSAVHVESVLRSAPQAVLDQSKKHVLFENQHQASLAEAWLSLCEGKVLR